MSTVIIIGGGGGGGQNQNRISADGNSVEDVEGNKVAVFTNPEDAIRYLKHLQNHPEA